MGRTRFNRLAAAIFAMSLAIFSSSPVARAQDQAPLVPDDYACTHPPYEVHLFSKSPLVIYISGFITPWERKHLLGLASENFQRSSIVDAQGRAGHDSVRTSQSTSVARDAVVRCIQSRALLFQGLPPSASSSAAARLEPLQLVKYGPGERYHFHTDWFTDPQQAVAAQGGNRASSFFGYVAVGNDTTGGGTNFPLLDAPPDDEAGQWWCDFVDCDAEWEDGVTFRPVEGNAVYWENLRDDGSGAGDMRTLHAGLPVTTGSKVGMNIWTRQAPLGEDIRGKDV